MMKRLLRLVYGLLILFTLLVCTVSFLISTTLGLYASLKIGQLFLPGSFEVHQLKGRLLDHFSIGELKYHHNTDLITLRNLNINWQLSEILHSQIVLTKLTAESLTITQNKKNNRIHAISLSAQGSIQDKNHGHLNIIINPGTNYPSKEGPIPSIQFKGGTINTVLNPQGLQTKGFIAIDDTKKLKVLFKLPHWDLKQGVSKSQAISGELSLVLKSLDFLDDLPPEINKVRGNLTAALKMTGTVGNVLLESSLNLKNASANIPSLGLDLDAINCTITEKSKRWEATGFLSSAGKKLILQGKGTLSPRVLGKISLQGTDFPISNTREYQINISPQLLVTIKPTTVHISGSILVPKAQIKPQTFNNSLTLDDVVYKSNAKTQTPTINTSLNTSMDVAVEMGNEVELTFKGLHATLAGKVNITQKPQGPLNANGELTVKEGEYKAYGQDLDIEQGQLLFTGGSIESPGINLKASKIIGNDTSVFNTDQSFDLSNSNLQNMNLGNNIKVGVEVTGRLTAPKILLFSNPAILSQADILSMLVLGRPASQANKAGGQLLLAAISSMNLGTKTNGAQLLEQLKQSVGLDFNVQTNTNYNQLTNQVSDSTSFVVGKALSKKLYLSYNVGLSQSDPNVLTLKYLLNKLFSVQVTSSLKGSGIDLLYSRSKDKINE